MQRGQASLASWEPKPTVACLHSKPACCTPPHSPPSGHSAGFAQLSQGKNLPTSGVFSEGRYKDLEKLLSRSQFFMKTGGYGIMGLHGPSTCPLLTSQHPPILLAPALIPPPAGNGEVLVSQGGGTGLDQCPIEGWVEWMGKTLPRVYWGPAAIYSSNLLPLFISEGPPGFPAASPLLTSCQWPSITGISTRSTLN